MHDLYSFLHGISIKKDFTTDIGNDILMAVKDSLITIENKSVHGKEDY